MAAIVQFENVGLRYGHGEEVLRDLTFSLAPGGFYFLTGASGAGKTSLLKLLYLAQRPARGTIRLFGTDVATLTRARMPAFRRRIGVVYQDFRLIPHLSITDNIALPLRIGGVLEDEVREAVGEMLAWVGLSHRAGARPATLSGGEQQRVAIARAVIARPDVLLADEPTGNVDEAMADRLMQLFVSLNGLGTTVVVATHDAHLLGRVPRAHSMRIVEGRLIDAAGGLRFSSRRERA
ncbi:cell division ATP-binding protein FtsE [Sphingomonas endophytica]|uniref:Cell division ATP-binding protein FtsE n=1 Tax=Sphingomonas endophytica TaxID=869719 RepID=A0A147I8A0_9SPHN|nr:cell division ATP-binding protein FtsE [Sphingomonas endophytica]KTT75377.1 cell division protein FtsE [Sphingomonas endophytica]